MPKLTALTNLPDMSSATRYTVVSMGPDKVGAIATELSMLMQVAAKACACTVPELTHERLQAYLAKETV